MGHNFNTEKTMACESRWGFLMLKAMMNKGSCFFSGSLNFKCSDHGCYSYIYLSFISCLFFLLLSVFPCPKEMSKFGGRNSVEEKWNVGFWRLFAEWKRIKNCSQFSGNCLNAFSTLLPSPTSVPREAILWTVKRSMCFLAVTFKRW